MSQPESITDRAERLRKLVSAMHAHFESLTNQRLTLSYQRMQAWHELIQREYSMADIALVIRWIKAQMGKPGSGFSSQSLQFSRLIQDADLFEDRLNMARQAYGRQLPPRADIVIDQTLPGGCTRQVEVPAPQREPQRISGEEALQTLRDAMLRHQDQ